MLDVLSPLQKTSRATAQEKNHKIKRFSPQSTQRASGIVACEREYPLGDRGGQNLSCFSFMHLNLLSILFYALHFGSQPFMNPDMKINPVFLRMKAGRMID